MGKHRSIEAVQWYKKGDHPAVRYYRTPEINGQSKCPHCGVTMHKHGWIDKADAGHTVCPQDWIIDNGSGEFYPCKPYIFYKYIQTHNSQNCKIKNFLKTIPINKNIDENGLEVYMDILTIILSEKFTKQHAILLSVLLRRMDCCDWISLEISCV